MKKNHIFSNFNALRCRNCKNFRYIYTESRVGFQGAYMAEKRNYKDNLFVSIFGRSVNSKEYFLSLYNAIHGTDFKIGEVTIEPVTLENVVYRGLNNDVSMMINDTKKYNRRTDAAKSK